MSNTKKMRLGIAFIIIVLLGVWIFSSKAEGQNAQPTQQQAFIEKRSTIGSLKWKEMEATKQAQEAKQAKDKLLEEISNVSTGFIPLSQ